MRRKYRLLSFKKGAAGSYLSLVAEWQDATGAWRSKVVRSYGADTAASRAQAQADLEELQRIAGGENAPIPVGTLNDAIWSGFQQTLEDPITALPSLPLLAARDLIHLGGYVLAQASGDLQQKALATQPEMPAKERRRLVTWLGGLTEDDLALALAYQWRMEP